MKCEVIDGKLIITINVGKDVIDAANPSKSGKTNTLYTTKGYYWATGVNGLGFNLTVSNSK